MDASTAMSKLENMKAFLKHERFKKFQDFLQSSYRDNINFIEQLLNKIRLFFLRRHLDRHPTNEPTKQAIEVLTSKISSFNMTIDQKKSVGWVWGTGTVATLLLLFIFTGKSKPLGTSGEALALVDAPPQNESKKIETLQVIASKPESNRYVAKAVSPENLRDTQLVTPTPKQPTVAPKNLPNPITLTRKPKGGWGSKELAEMKESIGNYIFSIPAWVEEQTGTMTVQSGIPGLRSNGYSIKQSSMAEEETEQKILAQTLWKTGPFVSSPSDTNTKNLQVSNIRVSRSGNEALVHVILLSDHAWSNGEWAPVTILLEDGRKQKAKAGVGLDWKNETVKSFKERVTKRQDLDEHEVEITFPLIDYPLVKEITVNARK